MVSGPDGLRSDPVDGRPAVAGGRAPVPRAGPGGAAGPAVDAPRERVLALQVLRGLAASGVIVLHATQVGLGQHQVGLVGTFGAFGVDLFFVLSGAIIARIAHGAAPVPFLVKRLTRIFPMYWIITASWMALIAFSGTLSLKPLLTSLFLLPTDIDCYLPIAWTLRFEVLFYLAATVALMAGRLGVIGLALAYAAAFLGRLSIPHNPVLDLAGSPLVLEFLAGVLVARLGATPWSIAIAGCTGLACLAAIGVSGYSGETDARAFIYGPPAAMIVYAARHLVLKGSPVRRLAYLGDASYCAYLVHLMPIFLVAPLMRSAPPALAIPGMMVGCWMLAVLAHEAAEKPALRLCRRLLSPLLGR